MVTQRWPTAWLLTDERLGEALGPAMERAARAGAGILVRHHRSKPAERNRIVEQVLALGAPLAIARDTQLARATGALFVHNPEGGPGSMPFSLSVHDAAEAREAARRGASLVFVSPVYPTRSHPDATTLGEEAALDLATLACRDAIALGGMNSARGSALMERGFFGWAGIDCWTRD